MIKGQYSHSAKYLQLECMPFLHGLLKQPACLRISKFYNTLTAKCDGELQPRNRRSFDINPEICYN